MSDVEPGVRIAEALERIASALEDISNNGIAINSALDNAIEEGSEGDFALKVYRVGAADKT